MRALSFGAAGAAAIALLAGGRAGAGDVFRKGPYLQNVREDGVTIVWEASGAVPARVRLPGAEPPQDIRVEPGSVQEVELGGLEPATRYRYRVEAGGEVARGEFATAPGPEAPISFVVFGDSRSNAHAHRRVVERVRKEVPDFVLGTGDMVDDGLSQHQWQRFFDIERELLRQNVLFPSLGNHDRQGGRRTADNYRRYFSLPENSPDPERYYAFTYGGARFLVLDSNAYSFALTDQTAWIEEQLQDASLDPEIDLIFVTMHHPPFSISLHGGAERLREAWTPLFETYQVDAVFSGHDHVYSRGERNGVRYFVSGGGGAPLYPRRRRSADVDLEAIVYFERVNHYLRVYAIGTFVEVTAIRADGTVIETESWGAKPKPVASVSREVEALVRPPVRPSAGPGAGAGPVVSNAGSGGGGGLAGFGWLGRIAAGLVVVAGGVLVWSLRR